jgi:cytochrome b6-f complex iron-sulfur subunit
MSTATIITFGIIGLGVLAALLLFSTTRSRDRASAMGALSRETRKRDRTGSRTASEKEEPATVSGREVERSAAIERAGVGTLVETRPAQPAVRPPLDSETYGVTRRQFFNRGIVAMFVGGLSVFGVQCIAFLWPQVSGGFGSKIRIGDRDEILGKIRATKEPFYVPEGRLYINPYPTDALDKAKKIYSGAVLEGMERGVVALYQKCVHLGCRVPWCKSAQWFECPCHGSKYNRVGEKKGGPAPRGLDRFGVVMDGNTITVDTKLVILGPPIGTNTTGQEQEGPHCA